ncbi:hypothetical protein OZX56_09120 [Lactobacillus sp. ESL0684]|uniref:hypothetical protein n=1 Tax=Lactobacillus sp. ESL0684 TaxID=2983213 RepID=UPI0023F8900D|nr:hypothetical protein [Lactobacillus sp. ESL0684]WEV43646.1 hypothetical protein OZX56_09120 [Lactobacillus sp. ESL0684]
MKKTVKLLGLVVAALGLTSSVFTADVSAKKAKTSQVSKKKQDKKYGISKSFKFSKDLQGKWYSNNNLTPEPLNIHKSSLVLPATGKTAKVAVIGKVKGTKKYPWQMSKSWKNKHAKTFKNVKRGTTKTISGVKWTILSSPTEKSTADGDAYAVHNEKVDDQTIKVVFEADPTTGKVYNQYFTTKDLADKYQSTKFADMTYTEVNWR